MELSLHELHGQRFLEGPPGQPLLMRVEDITLVIEACWEAALNCVLLYPENLTEHFFDLSSGEAGEILQKLRNYRIRLAIIVPADLPMGRRFADLLADERNGSDLRLFRERSAAAEWLCPDDQNASAAHA